MNDFRQLCKHTGGGAVVEATILFPIIIMIFTGLCLLAVYLPTRANLQHATQFAADAMAAESGDAWLYYDTNEMKYDWHRTRNESGMPNVYIAFFSGMVSNVDSDRRSVDRIVAETEKKGVYVPPGTLEVEYTVNNYIVYKELHVTATRTIKPPINLSFVGFPSEIPVTVTSSSVVLNGDEFVRNIDLVKELIENFSDITNSLQSLGGNSAVQKAFPVTLSPGSENSLSLTKTN